ncbi:MAG: taurine catabolism dioxygenase TauD, partial [Rhodospirillales bacterium]|nr:taurine catabolism dioxygenase TauD [Rhodospirillales bacterium]
MSTKTTNLSPFDPANDAAYQVWRAEKLKDYPAAAEDMIVPIEDAKNPSPVEIKALTKICKKTNMAIYASNSGGQEDKQIPLALAAHLGLTRTDKSLTTDEDGVTELSQSTSGEKQTYIPYT